MFILYVFAFLFPQKDKMIYNFEQQLQFEDWMIVNDGVMGGGI
jgi:hypothetical protein